MVEHGMGERIAQPGLAVGISSHCRWQRSLTQQPDQPAVMENSCSMFVLRSFLIALILGFPLWNSMEFCGRSI